MTTPQWNVTVKIIDSTGTEVMKFPASKIWSFSEDAEKAWFEIPTSCRAGACFVCAGRIKWWESCIDIGKLSVPLIDIDEDQVLMCIGWVKDEYFVDWEDHEIVIEKEM